MILFLRHIDIEGPGTLGDFLENQGFELKIIDLAKNKSLPVSLKNIEAVIVLGGPMNVYEEDKYLFLKSENLFIQNVLKNKIPYLGICLGAQLLAKAAGAKVVRSPQEEIGFSTVNLTKEAKADVLFKDLDDVIDVYQWHGDMAQLPASGVLLASSKECPHQAFRVGDNAYGLQFHVEITDRSIKEWADAYIHEQPDFTRRKKQMLADYEEKLTVFTDTANKIYSNFLRIIESNA